MPKRPKKFQAFKPHRCRRAKAQTLRTIVNRQIQKPSLEPPNLKPLKANACVFHLGAVSWQTFDFIARHGAQGLLYIYIYIYIFMYICIYIYIYTHTCTCTHIPIYYLPAHLPTSLRACTYLLLLSSYYLLTYSTYITGLGPPGFAAGLLNSTACAVCCWLPRPSTSVLGKTFLTWGSKTLPC